MPLVDRVADTLADEVCSDRQNAQPMPGEEPLSRFGVARIRKRLVDLEVVAPADELEAVKAPAARLPGQLFQR